MPRKCKHRIVNYKFPFILYKPAGVPAKQLQFVDIKEDELESLRLVYVKGLNMQQGALKMGISAPTFNRIVNSGLKKIITAIIDLNGIRLDKK